MAWFGKKEKVPQLSDLPRLPELPELPAGNDSFGQEMVKSAVSDSSVQNSNVEELPRDFKLPESRAERAEYSEEAIPEAPEEAIEETSESAGEYESSQDIFRPENPLEETEEHYVPEGAEIPTPAKRGGKPKKVAAVRAEPEEAGEAEEKDVPTGPVFVRIDKFEQAEKEFTMIQKKIREIESVLKRIMDAKAREDVELRLWMNELEVIKGKISEIDKSIFSNYGE